MDFTSKWTVYFKPQRQVLLAKMGNSQKNPIQTNYQTKKKLYTQMEAQDSIKFR